MLNDQNDRNAFFYTRNANLNDQNTFFLFYLIEMKNDQNLYFDQIKKLNLNGQNDQNGSNVFFCIYNDKFKNNSNINFL